MGDYLTWYEFKKDLERKSGRRLLNSDWLRVKPDTSLPWNGSLLRSSLDTLARLNRDRALPAGRN
jgi:hypothetical protein